MHHPFVMSLLVSVVLGPCAGATDFNVTPPASIQAAINQSTDGDRVLVGPGTYTEQIDFLGKSIAVIGTKGAELTILNGGGVGPVVRFVNNEGPGAVLQGLSVTGGFASQGAGGIGASSGATPTIMDCAIYGNHGKFGGGVTGSPILRRSVIRNNSSSLAHGGGIYGAPSMKYCVVANNTVSGADGGGAYINGSTTIEDCLFIENRAVFANSRGGGLRIATSLPVTLSRCVLANNSATGGAFAGVGGGIMAASGTTLIHCVVIGNTLTGSSLQGGGVYGAGKLINTIVRGNAMPQLSSVASVTFSDVEGGFSGTGNFDADPGFVDLSNFDHHLGYGSPCQDAGDPTTLDPDGSRSDVGAYPFETLYVANPDWTDPSWPEISVTVGGRQEIRILAGTQNANHVYVTAGSLSGTTPGFTLLGQHVPLNWDAYFQFTISNPGAPILTNGFGALDATGTGTTVFWLPGDAYSSYAGLTLHHATLVGTPAPALTLVTQPVRLSLVP